MKPIRFGLLYAPEPTIALEYEDESNDVKLLEVQVSRLKPDTYNVEGVVAAIQSEYPDHLSSSVVSAKQVTRLVGMLLTNAESSLPPEYKHSSPKIGGRSSLSSPPQKDRIATEPELDGFSGGKRLESTSTSRRNSQQELLERIPPASNRDIRRSFGDSIDKEATVTMSGLPPLTLPRKLSNIELLPPLRGSSAALTGPRYIPAELHADKPQHQGEEEEAAGMSGGHAGGEATSDEGRRALLGFEDGDNDEESIIEEEVASEEDFSFESEGAGGASKSEDNDYFG